MEGDKKFNDGCTVNNRMEYLLKRQADRRKVEKNGVHPSNLFEVSKFTDIFNRKQKEIEADLQSLRAIDPVDLSDRVRTISEEIQELQKLFSNATLFLRIYDKKVFQESLQGLQTKLQNLENELMPKKKFGFKAKKNKIAGDNLNFGITEIDSQSPVDDPSLASFVGISGRTNEEMILEGNEINKRDLMIKDLRNCRVRLLGVPSTVHATNIENCQLHFGPVSTSVFLENVKDSSIHLACQQLRIHETYNTDFRIHVTSKSVIENCRNLRFGIYDFEYDGIDDDYAASGLNRNVNNWDQVDDFNWLITNKPSPNWSKLTSD